MTNRESQQFYLGLATLYAEGAGPPSLASLLVMRLWSALLAARKFATVVGSTGSSFAQLCGQGLSCSVPFHRRDRPLRKCDPDRRGFRCAYWYSKARDDMYKLTCECVPYGVEVLPKASEVEALEGALLRWHDVVETRYGEYAAMATWRRACKVVVDFERGE